MNAPILVTGGTGTLGAHVVRLLRARDRTVRVISRRQHHPAEGVEYVTGDLATGAGADAALRGVRTVVHCAGGQKGDAELTRHLLRAATAAGVRHLVYISVVGAERMPVSSAVDRAQFGYFANKRETERVVEEGGIPYTTLRATQFHDLLWMTAEALAKSPVVPVFSGMRMQPVDTAEVAERLVELALGEPAGLVPDLAGPETRTMKDLLRAYLDATHKRRLLLPVRNPGRAGKALRAGAIITSTPQTTTGTWEAYLTARLGG